MACPSIFLKTNESLKADELKKEAKHYELKRAPLKRLLQRGRGEWRAKPKISEAALLNFQDALEDMAIEIAQLAGESAREYGRQTIQASDIHFARAMLLSRLMEAEE